MFARLRIALLLAATALAGCDPCIARPIHEERCAAGDAESCIELQNLLACEAQ